MTGKEFRERCDSFDKKRIAIEDEKKVFIYEYCLDVLEKNGYKIGDIVVNPKTGEKVYIKNVEYSCIRPRTVCTPLKKDGTPSSKFEYNCGFGLTEEEPIY